MSVQERALLIGDIERAPYHPLDAIEQDLRSILGGRFAIESHTEYRSLGLADLKPYKLCIVYTDCWEQPVSGTLGSGLASYAEQGGALLVIHNGISLQGNGELDRLIGARFTGHPPCQALNFRITLPEHPVMRGIPPFTLEEEPYQYEFHPQSELSVLLEYEADGQVWPAVWETSLGAGRLLYVMPGHHAPTFRHPVIRNLIRNAADWLDRNPKREHP